LFAATPSPVSLDLDNLRHRRSTSIAGRLRTLAAVTPAGDGVIYPAALLTHSTLAFLADMCWDKCITGSIGGRFSRGEEACLTNCTSQPALIHCSTSQAHSSLSHAGADRFLDSSLYLMKYLEKQRTA
jgi:hypothetical protein